MRFAGPARLIGPLLLPLVTLLCPAPGLCGGHLQDIVVDAPSGASGGGGVVVDSPASGAIEAPPSGSIAAPAAGADKTPASRAGGDILIEAPASGSDGDIIIAPRASGSLLEREPLGYDSSTVERLRRSLRLAPKAAPYAISRIGAQLEVLGIGGSLLVLLLLIAVGYGLPIGRKRFETWLETTALAPAQALLPSALRPWLVAIAQIVAAGLLPAALWGLHSAIRQATGYDYPAFVVLGILLLAWTKYTLATTIVRELVIRPLLPIPAEHGAYLYGITRRLLLFTFFQSALVETLFEVRALADDTVALVASIFQAVLILLVVAFLARKRAVMALFPEIANRPYEIFVRVFGAFYPLIVAFGAGLGLLAWAGFGRLARFMSIRSFAIVGLFLAAVGIHQLIVRLLRRWILAGRSDDGRALAFFQSSERLFEYLGTIAVVLVTLQLAGIREPLAGLLGHPVYVVGEQKVSGSSLLEASVLIAAFFFFARLLRHYLDFHVHPAFNVEEGAAHAINTLVGYLIAVAGIVIALQVVGLGVGSLTVFAGAIGIGVGFGLQSVANNLASGLILTFSRMLRKGDLVTIGDSIGIIQEVGIRGTRLRNRDGVDYLVPNAEFVNSTLINWTHSSPLIRVHVPVGVSYDADPERVRSILLEVARQTPNVAPSPPPGVSFVGFGESSIDFELLVWMNFKEVDKAKVRSDLNFAIFRALKQAGIEIPFPQRDLRIRSDGASQQSLPNEIADIEPPPAVHNDPGISRKS